MMAQPWTWDFPRAGAEFSAGRRYRYRLWRVWAPGPRLLVIGLNPSTADETADDPTIRRCIGYARRWGYGGLEMRNLFALRATDPREMMAAPDPMGDNYRPLLFAVAATVEGDGAVLAAWGAHGVHRDADVTFSLDVRRNWPDVGVACLGYTKGRCPRHPLYVRADAAPVAYLGDGGRLVTSRQVPA
jgi:hypothetical protein